MSDVVHYGTEARPFETKEEYEHWLSVCVEHEQRIKVALQKGREAMWELAEQLHEFDKQSGWTALGCETLGEWLADPEITMSRATFFRLVQGWHEYASVRQLPVSTLRQLDMTKMQIALPALKEGAGDTG